ncbi:hypothetical protein B484DRAFT_451176 [Ochromonadaceae sp. CCMP2298]|nr:hypothetical protein B484DRAFT_451176 [Ochromonadaceae sp. CCMP2298]
MSGVDDIDFLKELMSNSHSLAEEERLADSLVREALLKSRAFQAEHETRLPAHLEKFRLEFEEAEKKKLNPIPLISTLTPRTRRELKLLPKPNAYVEQKVQQLEELSRATDSRSLYSNLATKRAGPSPVHIEPPSITSPKRGTGNASVEYYETMDAAKRRAQEQEDKLHRLFDHENDSKRAKGARGKVGPQKLPRLAQTLSLLSDVPRVRTASPSKDTQPSVLGARPPRQAQRQSRPLLSLSSTAPLPDKRGRAGEMSGGPGGDAEQLLLQRVLGPAMADELSPPAPSSSSSLSRSLSSQSSLLSTGLGKRRSPPKVAGKSLSVPRLTTLDRSASTLDMQVQKQAHEHAIRAASAGADGAMRANPLAGGEDSGGSGEREDDAGTEASSLDPMTVGTSVLETSDAMLQRKRKEARLGKEIEYLNLFSVKVLDECGLDLNKSYNRIRNFTAYLMRLSYHFYMHRMRAGLNHWRSQYLKDQAARIARAARVVFNALKLGVYLLSRKEIKMRREAQRLEEEARQRAQNEARRKRVVALRGAVKLVVRLLVLIRRKRRRNCAIRIQRRARGVIGRRVAAAWKVRYLFLCSQALVMQCGYRGHLARRKRKLYVKLLFLRRWLEYQADTTVRLGEVMRQGGAETFIAKAYRAMVIRRKIKKLLYWSRYEKSIKIQCIYRGYCARKAFKVVLRRERALEALRHTGARRMQMLARRFLAVRTLHHRLVLKKKRDQARRQQKLLALATQNSNLPFQMVKLYRRTVWLRHKVLRRNAILIQRVWRGHHGRVRAFYVRVRRVCEGMIRRHELEMRAAQRLQRHWRSFMSRLRQKRKRTRVSIILLQSVMRINRAKRRTRQLRLHQTTALLLTQLLRRLVVRYRFRVMRKWRAEKGAFGVKIQTLARAYLCRQYIRSKRTMLRVILERKLYLDSRVGQLLAEAELQLIRDTLLLPLGHAPLSFSRQECPCLAPMQAMFTHAACAKGRTDPMVLMTNKADAQTVGKMLLRVRGLMDKEEKRKKKGVKKAHVSALFQEYDEERIVLPVARRRLKSNQVDICFNRAKRDAHSGNVLGYGEFTELLRLLAIAHYGTEVVRERETEEDEDGVGSPKKEGEEKGEEKEEGKEEHEQEQEKDSKAKKHRRSKEHEITADRVRCDVKKVFHGPEPDYRLALVLNAFASLRDEVWMAPVLLWMEVESKARVGVFATRIQCLVRKRFARSSKQLRVVERKRQHTAAHLSVYACRIQSLARKTRDRLRVAEAAQRTITKYIPHFGEAYWFNPKTMVTSVKKPKILAYLEAYTIALPEEGLENQVYCYFCNQPADVNCLECEDSYCKVCFESLHCKGQRTRHSSERIPKCSYCRFQVATKSCLGCILYPPAKGHIRESVNEAERSYYCDTCFVFEHDSNDKALQLHRQHRKDLKHVLCCSREATLVGQYLRQRIVTSHHYEDLVQTCEECDWRSSAWRCTDCSQVYCSPCLVGLHSIGGPFASHHAELLPFFTPAMHKSFKHDIVTQTIQTKLEKLQIVERDRRLLHHTRVATKVQSWWRMVAGKAQARKHISLVRRKQRIHHRARRQENLKVRSGVLFKVQSALGVAPALHTDTPEEAALRPLNAFQREAARHFAYANVEDWGAYRTSRTEPRKGTPSTGYDVGSPAELADQALNGGYRLPGRVVVQSGAQEFLTSLNLTRVLRPGEYVRVRERIFGVVKVAPQSVTVNRFWLAGDALIDEEEGDVMYRVPIYLGEPRRLEYRARYLAYAIAMENPLTQAGISASKYYASRMMTFSLYMVRTNRRNGMALEADAWRSASVKYADRVRRLNSYMNTENTTFVSRYGDAKWVPKEVEFPPDPLLEAMVKQRGQGLLHSMETGRSGGAGMGVESGHRKKRGEGVSGFDPRAEWDDESLLDSDSDSAESWDEQPQEGRSKPQPSISPRPDSRSDSRSPRPSSSRPNSSSRRPGSHSHSRPGSHTVVPTDESIDSLELGTIKESEKSSKEGKSTARGTDGGSFKGEATMSKKRNGLFGLFGQSEEEIEVARLADELHADSMKGGPRATVTSTDPVDPNDKNKGRKSKAKAKFVKPEIPWYANEEQNEAREAREEKMTPDELALEADDWKECVDIMTENIYFQNAKTNELMSSIPKAVSSKRAIEFNNSRNKKNYEEAQKRIQKMEDAIKHRTLITGGKRKN